MNDPLSILIANIPTLSSNRYKIFYVLEAATRGVLYKKMILEISQNSQENACARASFLLGLQLY